MRSGCAGGNCSMLSFIATNAPAPNCPFNKSIAWSQISIAFALLIVSSILFTISFVSAVQCKSQRLST
jgi:hypothetical protein